MFLNRDGFKSRRRLAGHESCSGSVQKVAQMFKENRGFASLSETKRRQIASKAGRVAHQRGTAHEWTPDEAREAGRKGGGILLGSGERATPRVDAIVASLDEIATSLDAMSPSVRNARAIHAMRQAIEKVTKAIDRIDLQMNS